MNNETVLSIHNLKKIYKTGNATLEVLKDITFDVKKGEILAIVGESGCGKTTLLNLIGGIDKADGGKIIIGGKNITAMNEASLASFRCENMGFIFQFHNLLSDFNAVENVMLPVLMKKYDKKAAKVKAEKLLDKVGLSNRATHRLGELSGGEQQRVAIARALVNNPGVLLADEPTGNLDVKTAESVQNLLWDIAEETEQTLIVVTHSRHIAKKADRILVLEGGSGVYAADDWTNE